MNKAALLAVGVLGVGAFYAAKSGAFTADDDAGPTPPDSDEGPVFTVTANSGAVYEVHHVKTFDTESGKQSFWDVFDLQGRVLRYSQLENDTNSRIFIVSPRAMNDPAVDLVMRDFGIRFEGGAVAIPATQTTTLPGQIMVAAGHWMATVNVTFPKSILISASLIKATLEEQGWKQVSVYTSVPQFWPISKNGNYFIEANWDRPAQIFQVPSEVVDIKSSAQA